MRTSHKTAELSTSRSSAPMVLAATSATSIDLLIRFTATFTWRTSTLSASEPMTYCLRRTQTRVFLASILQRFPFSLKMKKPEMTRLSSLMDWTNDFQYFWRQLVVILRKNNLPIWASKKRLTFWRVDTWLSLSHRQRRETWTLIKTLFRVHSLLPLLRLKTRDQIATRVRTRAISE